MTILLDHCIPRRYFNILQEWGYDVHLLSEYVPVESIDPVVIQIAQTLDAVLLRVDTDFQNIVNYPPQVYQGIIVIRHEHRTREAIAHSLKEALQDLYRDLLRGALVVVESDGYRVRRE